MKLLAAKGWMKLALMAFLAAGAASALYGDTIVPTYLTAKTEAPDTTALCSDTSICWVGEQSFAKSSVPAAGVFPVVTTVGSPTGTISGTYSGSLTVSGANEYGGTGGTGYFASVSDGSYTLKLTTSGDLPGVNYFGLWFSALDAGNDLKFYEKNAQGTETLLYDFTPALFQKLVGSCPNSSNAFCGNPSGAYKGEDSGEQYAFLNFFDTTGYIDEIVFTETTSAGLESDNQTVAYLDPIEASDTVIGTTPEPGTFVLLSIGAMAFILFRRPLAVKGMN